MRKKICDTKYDTICAESIECEDCGALKCIHHGSAVKAPLISVIIPTHSRKLILRNTIMALQRQTYHRCEIIVVSSALDGTNEMVRELSKEDPYLKLIISNDKSPTKKRNQGVAQARGRIIAFTDDDCIPSPDWLEKMAFHFQNPSVAGVEGKTIVGRGK